MVRKRTIDIALLVAALLVLSPVLCCCGLPYITPWLEAPGLTRDQFHNHSRLVRPGMSPDDVKAEFGQPHQEHTYRDGTVDWVYYERGIPALRLSALIVVFDKSGRVTSSSIAD